MNIGHVIHSLRIERGLTQEALALAANVATSNVSRIETGQRSPSIALLERLADALGTPVSAIYAAAEGMSDDKAEAVSDQSLADTQSLVRHFQSLSAGHQRLTVEYVKMLTRLQGQEPAP